MATCLNVNLDNIYKCILLEYTPLVHFIRNYIQARVAYFHILTNEDIDEIISGLFKIVCANLPIYKEITRLLEDMNYIFSRIETLVFIIIVIFSSY